MHDHNSLNSAMGALFGAFITDIQNSTSLTFTHERRRFERLMQTQGRRGILVYHGKVHDALNHWLATGTLDSAGMAHDRDGFPLYFNALWRLLQIEDDVVLAVRLLRQISSLFRKWAEDTVDPITSVNSFVDRMAQKPSIDFDLVDRIAEQLPFILGDQDLDETLHSFYPRVTSGARATKVPVLHRIDEIQYYGYASSLFHADGIRVSGKTGIRINRGVTVPKTWDKTRLVFAEPNSAINLQQCLRNWIEQRMVCTSRRVTFDDQTAQHRSLRKPDRSSIDLSDASDHVDRLVIWRFLRAYPRLRSALFWSRSAKTCLKGESVDLRCYGTMGNATTFTVMSLLLACLTREAEVHYRGYTGKRPRISTVFGDDIVCDDVIAGIVLSLLRDIGLCVNRRKTYIARAFKETCGLDLFRGEDVTPLYVRHVHVTDTASRLRLLDYSNRAHKAGYWNLAATFASLIGKTLSVNVDTGSLFSYSNGYVESGCRWDKGLQKCISRILGRPQTARPKERDSIPDLSYALYHGCRIRDLGRQADSVFVS